MNSGLPLTVSQPSGTYTRDAAGLGCIGASGCSYRPNMIGDPNDGKKVFNSWFDTSVFVATPVNSVIPGQRTSRHHPCTWVSGEWPALRFALKNFCGLSDNPEGARRRPKPTGLDENLPSLAANADAMAEESNTRNAEGSKHFRPEPMTVLSRPPKNGPRSPQPAFRRFHPLGKRAASFSAVQTAHLFMSPSVSTT